jgi:hypothetical protein
MKIFRTISTLAFVSIGIQICHAQGIDCEKAKTQIEIMVCNSELLSWSDEYVAKTYQAVLDIAPNKVAEIVDQRRWLSSLRSQCKDPQCIEQLFAEREAVLQKRWEAYFSMKARIESRALAGKVGSFEGNWQSCSPYRGEVICSSYAVLQNKRHVCGVFEHWASSLLYPGQFQAQLISPSVAAMKLKCGRGLDAECDDDQSPSGRWVSTSGDVLKICNGQLYQLGKDSSCSELKGKNGYVRFPIDKKYRETLLNEPWLAQCLKNGPM